MLFPLYAACMYRSTLCPVCLQKGVKPVASSIVQCATQQITLVCLVSYMLVRISRNRTCQLDQESHQLLHLWVLAEGVCKEGGATPA